MTTPNMSQTHDASSDSHSPQSHKRQRAKQACEPCRLRKRRCDGDLPCNMCVKFDYKCYFEKHSRKRSKIVERDAAENGITAPLIKHEVTNDSVTDAATRFGAPKAEQAAPEELIKLRYMEANSGIAFTRLFGIRLDASAGPKLFTFGWNVGSTVKSRPSARPVTDILTLEQLLAMTTLFSENMHPLYGFLNHEWIVAQVVARYAQITQLSHCPDRVLLGIALVGSQFASGAVDDAVPAMIDSVISSLETNSTSPAPALCDVQAWLLRVMYLRFAGQPHSCWVASCTTMHLIECIDLHRESSEATVQSTTTSTDPQQDLESRRRTFWVARMFNSWVSFEYGRNRVAMRGITCLLPEARPGDFTRDYVLLYSLSCCLDPELLDKPGQWEDFLQQLESFEARHECITLSKANLGLCAYRRLRLANPNVSSDTINRIVTLATNGLEAARIMATRRKPWWHTANVPFQSICVFLAIDSKESLSHLANAIRVLEFVAEAFPSPAIKEALKTSRFLVRLSKRKKDQDSEVLAQSLLKDAGCDPRPENLEQPVAIQANGAQSASQVTVEEAPLTTSSSGEEWNLDYLNNSEFDWNFFLSQDIPAFQHMAPDGMM